MAMTRKGVNDRKALEKSRRARFQAALARPELRLPSVARESPASPTSAPTKKADPAVEALVQQYLARK
jgi:hypothetical protein